MSRHEPIVFDHALSAWEDWAKHHVSMTTPSIRATRSAVMTTISYTSERTGKNWERVDLRPILFDLPTYAVLAHGHTRCPGDASGRVKRWVDQLLAREGDSKIGRAEPFLPPVYRPLLLLGSKGMPSIMLMLERAAYAAGWTEAPLKWPAAEKLHEGAVYLGIAKHSMTQGCRDYRHALDRLRASDPDAARTFGDLPYVPHNKARHIGVALGMAEAPAEALKLRAPELYADVNAYLTEPESPGLAASDAWKKLALGATARLAGSLARAGFEHRLATMTFLDLWRPTEVRALSAGGVVRRARASLQLDANAEVKFSPLRLGLDADKDASNRISPSSPSGGYNQGAMHQAQIAWSVLDGVYGDALRAQNPTEWATMQASWNTLQKHIKKNWATAQRPKNKELAVETLNYAQILVIVNDDLTLHRNGD